MPHQPTCQAADFFVLRSPSLPVDALHPRRLPRPEADPGDASAIRLERDREALRQVLWEVASRAEVREAVSLASPDLASRLGAWLLGTLDDVAARGVERALLKYLGRMSSRATPFGLFASVSRGTWGPASDLAVGAWLDCRKTLRLDWGVLETLVNRLEQAPEVRALLSYRPNASMHSRGGRYRYLEHRDQTGAGRTYHLEAAEASPHLDFALQQAQWGASLEDLTAQLAHRQGVTSAEAQAFLERIIQAQVLCGDLQPPLTSCDALGHLVTALRRDPVAAPRAILLAELDLELKRLQNDLVGAHPEGYPGLAVSLADLGVPPETRDVVQVDLFRSAPNLALSPVVRRVLEEGAETLRRLTPAPVEGALDRFRAAFTERYETRWMPLLEVLDEESGIGFDGAPTFEAPLLVDLPFQGPPTPQVLTRRDRHLMAQIPKWHGVLSWELEDADLEALANPDPQPFPPSFAALTTLAAANPAALDRGDFQFWMEHYSGSTAARWLGRFASGDSELKDALQRHLRKEEAGRPGAAFAEVVHVPEGRMGNVLARPALRDYEIPFLATSGVPREGTILPSELQVTVRGGRVLLASSRLGREVVPRLSSAHNFTRGPVIYRFLARLQDQDGRPGGWSWGALGEQPFLPRVTRGRQVLSKARWRVEAKELRAAMARSKDGAWGAFQALRETRGLPRFVLLTDADNSLLVDLDEVLWVETLHHLVSSRSGFILTECFPEPGQTLVTAPEGGLAHELVIPFEASAPGRSKAFPLPSAVQTPVVRAFPPGSEWLSLKIYCGEASADHLLAGLEPLLRLTKQQGLWDRWHFIRYRDPHPHLRLRFHGIPLRLLAELLPLIHKYLEPHLAQGLLWKWQVDTFEPEWERYGGALGFELAEAWFFEDSQRVLNQLVSGMTPEQRWRRGLRDADAIWAALGLSIPARKSLAQTTRDGFRKEFGDAGEASAQVGVRFRAVRKELEQDFPLPGEAPCGLGLRSLSRIREAGEEGLLQEDLAHLAGSFTHMHLNRLLRASQRENEWVLMEFLTRLYDSHLARLPKAHPLVPAETP